MCIRLYGALNTQKKWNGGSCTHPEQKLMWIYLAMKKKKSKKQKDLKPKICGKIFLP